MSNEKVHQSNRVEYQIRVDGKPVYYSGCIGSFELEKWVELCEKHPDCYVDIVQISTHIIFNQGTYRMLKKHVERMRELTTTNT